MVPQYMPAVHVCGLMLSQPRPQNLVGNMHVDVIEKGAAACSTYVDPRHFLQQRKAQRHKQHAHGTCMEHACSTAWLLTCSPSGSSTTPSNVLHPRKLMLTSQLCLDKLPKDTALAPTSSLNKSIWHVCSMLSTSHTEQAFYVYVGLAFAQPVKQSCGKCTWSLMCTVHIKRNPISDKPAVGTHFLLT